MLSDEFSIKDLGELKYYLGIEIIHDKANRTITLSQRNYIDAILERFHMVDAHGKHVPIPAGTEFHNISTELDRSKVEEIPYRSAVGSLLYLAICTRPDISTPVSKLSKYIVNFSLDHWTLMKGTIRYLKETRDLGLVFKQGGVNLLTAYADASYADPEENRRSTTGFMLFHGDNLISWATYTQPSIARSTAEAEYCAMSDCAQEVVWMRRLFEELGNELLEPTKMFEDNQGCIALAYNPVHHKRMKHIDVKYHFLREQVMRQICELIYCPTEDMRADILTKILPRRQYEVLRSLLGLAPIAGRK